MALSGAPDAAATTAAPILTSRIAASGDGPPLAHTGGFGEPNCQACHWENPLNDGGVAVALDGAPARYTPGARYTLRITLRHREMKVAGFQLSVRSEGASPRGTQAGTLRTVDDRARVVLNDTTGIQYAGHTRTGTALPEPGVASWTVEWTAPTTAGAAPVIIHIAANAADDNNSEGGDFIYVAELRSQPSGNSPLSGSTPRRTTSR